MRRFETESLPAEATTVAPDGSAVRVLLAWVCLTLPLGTHFQFRAMGEESLEIIGVTMPPWPGEGEAYRVSGK